MCIPYDWRLRCDRSVTRTRNTLECSKWKTRTKRLRERARNRRLICMVSGRVFRIHIVSSLTIPLVRGKCKWSAPFFHCAWCDLAFSMHSRSSNKWLGRPIYQMNSKNERVIPSRLRLESSSLTETWIFNALCFHMVTKSNYFNYFPWNFVIQ